MDAEAVQVRDDLEEVSRLFAVGDLRWRGLLDEASERAERIRDRRSHLDACMRVGLLRHHALLHAGDLAGAGRALDGADDCLAALEAWVDGEDARRRHRDQVWSLTFTRAQFAQARGQIDEAMRLGERCRQIAPDTLDPARRLRHSLVLQAASALAGQRLLDALDAYGRAVDLFRREEPEGLGVVLLGLAQAQLLTGRLDEAAHTADRAEPLLGADLDQLFALRQLRALLATQRHRHDLVGEMGALVEEVDERYSHRQRQQAEHVQVTLQQVTGDPDGARAAALAAVASARVDDDREGLADALLRLAALSQDQALASGEADGLPLHHAALAALEEAAALVEDSELPLQPARIQAAIADYLAQWHREVDGLNIQVLRGALDRARAAAASLEAFAASATTAPARRDLAASYAEQPLRVAFDLAFRLGEKELLAAMIEERAARLVWAGHQDFNSSLPDKS